MNGTLGLEGLEKVAAALTKADKEGVEQAMEGMERAGMSIIADAQYNLRNNGSVVTGLLRQSGKVQKVSKTELDVGFFDTTNKTDGYAFFLEYGRRAGRFPPIDMLTQWARKKFGLEDAVARRMGFLTARKIARDGSTPHPFFFPAVKANERKIINYVKDALRLRSK